MEHFGLDKSLNGINQAICHFRFLLIQPRPVQRRTHLLRSRKHHVHRLAALCGTVSGHRKDVLD